MFWVVGRERSDVPAISVVVGTRRFAGARRRFAHPTESANYSVLFPGTGYAMTKSFPGM